MPVEQGQAPGAVVEEWLREVNKMMKVETSPRGLAVKVRRERKVAGG